MSAEAERSSVREAMHRRVEDSLGYQLTMIGLKDPGSPDLLEVILDRLPLYVAIGALSQEEAEAWRKRFTLAADALRAPDSEVVGEGQRRRARELLAEVLAAYEEGKPDCDTGPFRRFQAGLPALEAVGSVSEDEVSERNRRFHEVLEQRSRTKQQARQQANQESREETEEEARRYIAAELSRVVLGPPQRLNGVRVTCAELYEDCAIVRWHRLLSSEEISEGEKSCSERPTAEEAAIRFGAVFSLEDDLGTPYLPAMPAHQITGDRGLSENDKPAPIWGRSVFLPTVPKQAKVLRALKGKDVFPLRWT